MQNRARSSSFSKFFETCWMERERAIELLGRLFVVVVVVVRS
jgi:hypothetical protein